MKRELEDEKESSHWDTEKKSPEGRSQIDDEVSKGLSRENPKWKWFGWIYKWRYVVAILILVVCVLFEVSGSSIGAWSFHLDGTYGRPYREMTGDVLGGYREIRSDEWNVSTPMAFSQYYNQTGEFPYFSDTIRGDKTDAFIVYGQPVKSWEIMFRPFQIGYLFLGPSKGLSFFWCARFLALFLVSLEFGMYLTRKKKLLSIVYALFVSCSPVVAWWFAINGLVEMLIFGQLAILWFVQWMHARELWKKLLYTLGIAWSGVIYILLFYPAWQVPYGFVFLFLLIGIFLQERKHVVWRTGQVLLSVTTLIGSMAVPLVAIFYKSAETIKLVLNTSYPGNQMFLGEKAVFKLLNWPMGLFFPYRSAVYSTFNVCEAAVMFSFFPAGLILGIVWVIKNREKNPLLISMIVGTGFLLLYSIVPFPGRLADLTMQGMTTGRRAIDSVGFLGVIMLIYVIGKGFQREKFKRTVCISTVGAAIFALGCLYVNTDYIGKRDTLALFLVLATGMFFLILAMKRQRYEGLVLFALVVAWIGGGAVNPVHVGAESIYSSKLYQAIREETLEDKGEGLWLVEHLSGPYQNLPMMAGAPTINSTNVYPNLKRWEKIDKDKTYKEVYNRYAHITVQIVDETSEEPAFASPIPDQVQVKLRPEQLETLDVSHILTDQDLSKFNRPDVSFEKEMEIAGFYIYNVSYH